MSSQGQSTIERAVQLARESSCASIDDVRRTLSREGHSGVDAHLSGSSFKKQLLGLIAERKAAKGR